MKRLLITIITSEYSEFHRAWYEQRHQFRRPMSQGRPTFVGAARMVARETGVRPCTIGVVRIETAILGN